MMNEFRKSRVLVLALGGTIASTGDGASSEEVAPRLSAQDLVDAVPQLHNVAHIESLEFRQVPSGDLTLTELLQLAAEIERSFESGVDGVVVTQGTDTIEETSFALDLLVSSSRPVVITGAMRNPTQAGPDGPANLMAAVQVAASPLAGGLGTLVVMNDQIHAARFVRKTHSTSPASFQSPTSGPLGWVIEDRVRVVARVERVCTFGSSLTRGEVAPVALITCALGDDGRILENLVALGYQGAVIQGFGAGHVPATMAARIAQLARVMPVMLATRTGSGEILTKTYGFAGSESDLAAKGVLSAGLLDGLKARVLLSIALTLTSNVDDALTQVTRVMASLTPQSFS